MAAATVERTGTCQGYLCTCRVFHAADVQPDKVWRTCTCKHVEQTHSTTDPAPVQRTTEEDPDE